MGKAQSKASTEIVTNIVNEVMTSDQNKCITNTTTGNIISQKCNPSDKQLELYMKLCQSGVDAGYSSDDLKTLCRPCVIDNIEQESALKIDVSCMAKSDNITEMQDSIMSKIDQNQNTITKGILTPGASSETKAKVLNDIKSTFSTEFMNEMITNLNVMNAVKQEGVGGSISNVRQKSAADMVLASLSDRAQVIKKKYEGNTEVVQEQKTKATGLAAAVIEDITGIFKQPWMIAIAVIVGLGALGAIIYFSQKKKKQNDPYGQQQYQPSYGGYQQQPSYGYPQQ